MYRHRFCLLWVVLYYLSCYHYYGCCYAWVIVVPEKSLWTRKKHLQVVLGSLCDDDNNDASCLKSCCPEEDDDSINDSISSVKDEKGKTCNNNNIRNNNDGGKKDDDDNNYYDDISHTVWTPQSSSSNWTTVHANSRVSSPVVSIIETLRWCRNIVLPLDLCPWARASLENTRKNSIQFYSVKEQRDMMNENLVEDVARLFQKKIVRKETDPSIAIDFLVCEDLSWEFRDFFDWFCYIEEEYWGKEEWHDEVTLAAFHPDWSYNDDGDEKLQLLQFEKKSPYPTLTFVWTDVVEAASEVITNRIAQQNEETLLQRNVQEMEALYRNQVYIRNDTNRKEEGL